MPVCPRTRRTQPQARSLLRTSSLAAHPDSENLPDSAFISREPSEAMAELDQFDELIRKAYGIPFTDQVRLDRGEVYVLLDRLRTAVNHPPVDVAGLLDELVQRAKPIPLTNQIRIDREEIYDLLDRIRTTPLRRTDEYLTR